MQIDFISDMVCPWCFIGKRRLERLGQRSLGRLGERGFERFGERVAVGIVERLRGFGG